MQEQMSWEGHLCLRAGSCQDVNQDESWWPGLCHCAHQFLVPQGWSVWWGRGKEEEDGSLPGAVDGEGLPAEAPSNSPGAEGHKGRGGLSPHSRTSSFKRLTQSIELQSHGPGFAGGNGRREGAGVELAWPEVAEEPC